MLANLVCEPANLIACSLVNIPVLSTAVDRKTTYPYSFVGIRLHLSTRVDYDSPIPERNAYGIFWSTYEELPNPPQFC